jgi:uncharacterized repeat protein (TIGR02543 family)
VAFASQRDSKNVEQINNFIEPQQSRTGPTPPKEVIQRDLNKVADNIQDVQSEVTLSAPSYLWRHGCGPTALGMVVGFYDMNGFDDLIPGSAATQTSAVDQIIASGGDDSSPNPPGSELHYEDYARPQDYSPTLLPDDYITSSRTPHSDDSIADYMDTSKSTRSNYYGWSWSSDMGPAFVDLVNQQNSSYSSGYTQYNFPTLNWSILTNEIDAGRPMVFLVDSNGDGGTDHFVTVIGYRDSPSLQYASWDTWYTNVRWENFAQMGTGVPWGIWGAWAFNLSAPALFELRIEKAGDGSGKITSEPPGIDCGSTCNGMFSNGTEVTLTAISDPGSTFDGWSGACTNTSGPCVVTMTAAKDVTAIFSKVDYPLTVHKTGDGSGIITSDPPGIDCGSICDGMFSHETEVTLTATADLNSTFDGWNGACTNTSGPCLVKMTESKDVTAIFSKVDYPLTVHKTGNGSGIITSDPLGIDCGSTCNGMFSHGTEVTLTANEDPGSTFDGWSGACTNTSGPCVVTMTDAKEVSASFSKKSYVLTVDKNGNGVGVVSSDPPGIDCGDTCEGMFSHGSIVKLTAIANSGSAFTGWSGACADTSDICELTMIEAKEVMATFETYTIYLPFTSR